MSAESASRNRLQEDPGIMRDFPQIGTKLSPHLGKFRQGIEALDFGRQEII